MTSLSEGQGHTIKVGNKFNDLLFILASCFSSEISKPTQQKVSNPVFPWMTFTEGQGQIQGS